MSTEPLTFRNGLTQRDVASIRTMVSATGVFSAEEIEVAEELAQDSYTLGAKSHYHFILAERGEKLVGYSCFGRIPLTAERYDLYWIVVDPEARKQNIASELMIETEEETRVLGGKALYAETSSRAVYLPAHRFYQKHEFHEAARLKDFYADGDDKVIFGKTL